jgi:hypothetical protein
MLTVIKEQFVTHIEHQNQIALPYANYSLSWIALITLLLFFLSFKKREKEQY